MPVGAFAGADWSGSSRATIIVYSRYLCATVKKRASGIKFTFPGHIAELMFEPTFFLPLFEVRVKHGTIPYTFTVHARSTEEALNKVIEWLVSQGAKKESITTVSVTLKE
jgi:hypothetical protein